MTRLISVSPSDTLSFSDQPDAKIAPIIICGTATFQPKINILLILTNN